MGLCVFELLLQLCCLGLQLLLLCLGGFQLLVQVSTSVSQLLQTISSHHMTY